MTGPRRAVNPIALIAALTALGGCTAAGPASTGQPKASISASACTGGTVSLGPLHRASLVTEVSEVTTIKDPRGGAFTTTLRPVRTIVAKVTAEGVADEEAVFAQFLEKADQDVAPLGQSPEREERSGQVTVGGPGEIVVFSSVQQVEASFTYRCGTLTTSGVVSSWRREATGLAECDLDKPSTVDVAVETTALAC